MNARNKEHLKWLRSYEAVVEANVSHARQKADELAQEIAWREQNRLDSEAAGYRFKPEEQRSFRAEVRRLQQVKLDCHRVVEAGEEHLTKLRGTFGLAGTLQEEGS